MKINKTITLSESEFYVVFAALTSMVCDNHCVQDNLSEPEWVIAEKLFTTFENVVNEK